jgi:uncharacterized phiE125 gp8 family phage protein
VLTPVRIAAPVQAPITLDQAKQHLRVLHDDEDEYIAGLIDAAADYLDGYSGVLGRALITQTWRQDFDSFWYGCGYYGAVPSVLRLPLGPVQRVTSITYYDTANSLQTLLTSVYELLNDGLGPYVALVAGQSWPAVYSRAGAVSATWIAGYGATPEAVPSRIRTLVKLLVGHWYENREAVTVGNTQAVELPLAAQALIATSRSIGF